MDALLIRVGEQIGFFSKEIDKIVFVKVDVIFRLEKNEKTTQKELDLSQPKLDGWWIEISDFRTKDNFLPINRQIRTAKEIRDAILRKNGKEKIICPPQT